MPELFGGGGRGSSLNINMPTYSGSLKEGLDAQVALLTGGVQGDANFSNYADIGGLRGIVNQYERPLRMDLAQLDTDVLRQTLLGNRVPIYGDEALASVEEVAPVTTPVEEVTPETTPVEEVAPEPEVEPEPAAELNGFQKREVRNLAGYKERLAELQAQDSLSEDEQAEIERLPGIIEKSQATVDAFLKPKAESGKGDDRASAMLEVTKEDIAELEAKETLSEDEQATLRRLKTQSRSLESRIAKEEAPAGRRSGKTTKIDYGGTVEKDGRVRLEESTPAEKMYVDLAQSLADDDLTAVDKTKLVANWVKENPDSVFSQNITEEEYDKIDEAGLLDDTSVKRDVEMGLFGKTEVNPALIVASQLLFTGESETLNQYLEEYSNPQPTYKKNADGTDFFVPKDKDGNFILESDAGNAEEIEEIVEGGDEVVVDDDGEGEEVVRKKTEEEKTAEDTGEVIGFERAGDGLIDLLGDRRDAIDPTTGKPEVGRQAGFDADGKFLGLSALAEDIQRGNLSRQREADLSDVERLKDRYKTVMDDFKPATSTGISDAQKLLEEQKTALTGGGSITIPTADTYGGDVSGQTMRSASVADPTALTASTQYDALNQISGPELGASTSYQASLAGAPMDLTSPTSYDASAGVMGGNIQADALRNALMTRAENALDDGLTDREIRAIEQASRARQTASGRIFDPTATIEEAQAVIEGDRNRLMQNRAFAQGVLGQEAGLQESDFNRSLQAQLANQRAVNEARRAGMQAGLSQEALAAQQLQAQQFANMDAQNRASQFGVSAGMGQEEAQARLGQQADLANLQAEQRRQDVGLQAGLEQDALRANLAQRTDLAQAGFDQQANQFGAESAQRAALANQAQAQQASQFGVGAQLDAESTNERLKQAGLLGYVDAVGRLAQIEDKYTLDPFQAILGRGGGGSLAGGQAILGSAGYGLGSSPQFINPESSLGFTSQMAANQASINAAQLTADAARDAGRSSAFGSIVGGALGGVGSIIGGMGNSNRSNRGSIFG